MFTDETRLVIGVDTHRDAHAYAVVERATGVVVDQFEYPADQAGYRDALRHAKRVGVGGRAWAAEGTGSYGSGLTRLLQSDGELVVEVRNLSSRLRRSSRLISELGPRGRRATWLWLTAQS